MPLSIGLLAFQVYYFVYFASEANKRVGRHLYVFVIGQFKTILSKNDQVHPKAQGVLQEEESFFYID